MKLLTFTDSDGFNHASLVRDNDSDPLLGLIQSPPDVRELDWEQIKRNIHNKLLERGLLTLSDVQIRNVEFNQVIMSSVVKPIFGLYQKESK